MFLLAGLSGCGKSWQNAWIESRDKEIQKATRALETATGNAQRAELFSQRGWAYSEKVRYSRVARIISMADYESTFKLAMQDFQKALELDAKNPEIYFNRGMSQYFRAVSPDTMDANPKIYFSAALNDFKKTIELDPNHVRAYDMKGLVDLNDQRFEEALQDFKQVMRFDMKLGVMRTADTYCYRGMHHQRASKASEAIADYEKAIDLGVSSTGCECDPYNPLIGLYLEKGDQLKAQNVVNKAKASKHWVAEEFTKQLTKKK